MDEFSEINIAPLTDILLVLMVIFVIMAALIVPAGFQEAFPCSCMSRPAALAPYRAELTVQPNGRTLLNGIALDARSIYRALQALHIRHRRLALDIIATPRVPYGAIIRAMDAAKEAGIANVWFVVT